MTSNPQKRENRESFLPLPPHPGQPGVLKLERLRLKPDRLPAQQLPSLAMRRVKPVAPPATLQNPMYSLRPLRKNEDERGYKAWQAGGRNGKLEIGGQLTMVQEDTGSMYPETYHGIVQGYHRLGLSESSVWVEFGDDQNKQPISVLASNNCIHFPLTLRILMILLSFFLFWEKATPNSSDPIANAEEGRAPFLKVSTASFGNLGCKFTVIIGGRT